MDAKRSSPWRWWLRRRKQIMIAVAVLPLFQSSACMTGLGQVLGSVGNAVPALAFNTLEGVFLLPVELVLELVTGGTGGNGSGNSSGTGGFGNTGTGSSGLGGTGGLGNTSGI